MPTDILTQPNTSILVIILVVLVLREIIPLFKKSKLEEIQEQHNLETEKINSKANLLLRDVGALYDMHNVKDQDGTYIWYVRSSLEEAISKLTESIITQNIIFRELVTRLEIKGEKDK